jgi:hypothetical protein
MELHIRTELLYMMQEMTIEKIKVKELVDRAKIGRSTFYLHYDAVDAVLGQIETDFFNGLKAYLPMTTKRHLVTTPKIEENSDYLEEIVRGLDFLSNHSLTVVTLCGEYGNPSFKESVLRYLTQVISWRLRNIPNSKSVSAIPSYVIEYMTKGWLASVLSWLKAEDPADPYELAKMFRYQLLGASLACEAMTLTEVHGVVPS